MGMHRRGKTWKERKVVMYTNAFTFSWRSDNEATALVVLEKVLDSNIFESQPFKVKLIRDPYTGALEVKIPKKYIVANKKLGYIISTGDLVYRFRESLRDVREKLYGQDVMTSPINRYVYKDILEKMIGEE